MDFISDNFISYGETFAVKQEKLADADPSLPSSISDASESTSLCTGPVPPTLQNFLNSTNPVSLGNNGQEKQVGLKKHQPFRIIKTKGGEPAENINLKIENDEKILSRTKRIMKRVKAKQRIQLKLEACASVSPTGSKCPQDLLNDSNLDEKSKKKMVQMIRNRISAQNSRDRKKFYMHNLEQSKNKLSEDNSRLRSEKSELLKEIKRLEQTQAQLSTQNKLIRKGFKFICDSGNEDYGKTLIGDEGHILLTKHFGKDFEEVSSMIMSKFPNCDKSLFNSVFTFATFLSLSIMTDMTQKNAFPSQDVESIEQAEKMLSQVFGNIGNLSSDEPKEDENPSLITCLNDFSMKDDHSANYKSFLESHLHAGRTLSQSSDIIKIEESDHNGAGFYNNPIEADLVAKDSALQNLSEDPSFNLFSPRNFKALDERESKVLNPKSDFEDIENFQEDQTENVELLQSFVPKSSAFADLTEITSMEVSQSEKEKNDTGLMGLLLKALINPDLLQKTNKQ